MDERNDAALLQAWREGDRAAGGELFERYFASVCRFFLNKARAGAVEDLVQRTFLACAEARDRIDDPSRFRSYLFGIACNVLRVHLRERSSDGGVVALSAVTSLHDLDPSPTSVLVQQRLHTVLLEALRRIPLEHQVAFELYYWEEMSGTEVAAALGIPEGTLRTRLRKGKQLLGEAVAQLSAPRELDAHRELCSHENLERSMASLRVQLHKLTS